jgi:hypothetical protein
MPKRRERIGSEKRQEQEGIEEKEWGTKREHIARGG